MCRVKNDKTYRERKISNGDKTKYTDLLLVNEPENLIVFKVFSIFTVFLRENNALINSTIAESFLTSEVN